jgi:hypothetical protein
LDDAGLGRPPHTGGGVQDRLKFRVIFPALSATHGTRKRRMMSYLPATNLVPNRIGFVTKPETL